MVTHSLSPSLSLSLFSLFSLLPPNPLSPVPFIAYNFAHVHTHILEDTSTAVALGFEVITLNDQPDVATPSTPPLSSVTSNTTASATSDSDTDNEDLPEGWEERLVSFLAPCLLKLLAFKLVDFVTVVYMRP